MEKRGTAFISLFTSFAIAFNLSLRYFTTGVTPPGKKTANKKKSKAKKGENNDGSDDDGGDSVGTLVTIALQSNSGKLQEIPAPVPKSKKGNKGTSYLEMLHGFIGLITYLTLFTSSSYCISHFRSLSRTFSSLYLLPFHSFVSYFSFISSHLSSIFLTFFVYSSPDFFFFFSYSFTYSFTSTHHPLLLTSHHL